MKLWVVCGICDFANKNEPYLTAFYTKPTLKELEEVFGIKDEYNQLSDLLTYKYVEIGDYQYKLICINLDDKKLLSNIDIDMKILTYTDRVELGCNIENVITSDIITEDMINTQAISDIRDVYEKDEYDSEEEAVKELLEGNSVWLKNHDGVFEWHTINTKNINKTEE